MSNSRSYTLQEIHIKNNSSLWRQGISIADKSPEIKQYKLHATGYADVNGRKYVALPICTDIKDPLVIAKYNLM